MANTPASVDVDRVLPVVVGAHLQAELSDRASAYRACAVMSGLLGSVLEPVVCTDVWYMNSDALRSRPTVSIGAPGINALGAHLADRLPSVFVIDDVLMVQLDLETAPPAASCWGVDADATARAVEVFCERHVSAFLEAVARTPVG